MNTESVDCRKVEFEKLERPGDFCFLNGEVKTHLAIWLPGEDHASAIQIQKGPAAGNRVWGWDGNEEKPTLTPSIHAPGIWHGWLKNGRLESC